MRHLCAAVTTVILACAAIPVAGAETPPPAAEVVAAAVARAQAERKAVLIEFGASWCTWCRNFEAFVQSPDAGPVLTSQFVIVNLTVHEREGKKALENPGGEAFMERWGGASSGLPFYVFLDAAGSRVANSNAMPDGSNIGFPAVPEEIQAFVALMDKAAPSLTPEDRDTLQRYLVSAMPKPGPR